MSPSPRLTALVGFACLLAAVPGPALAAAAPPSPARDASPAATVIVRGLPGGAAALRAAVQAAGGTVSRPLGLVDGLVAQVPAGAVAGLARAAAVTSVTQDARLTLSSTSSEGGTTSPLTQITEVIGADRARASGASGRGVDVAVLDSGVVPVDGLRAAGKVVNGADLSFDSGRSEMRHLDAYGHGTHMAGIVAGRDDAVPTPVRGGSGKAGFTGIAPDARIVNVKVADAAGATDVSQVIAGLDWIVQHGDDGDLDVRVVNLSFGTDGVQDYRLDPLAYAVERAWRAGLVVVVSAGNAGHGSSKLDNPAYDPYVLAVGGSDTRGTASVADDVVAPWSSRGDADRGPDLVAPGASVVSLRSPGSFLDTEHPAGRSGTRFFRGSGTSQAAAVVSGAAALLLQQRPGLSPDQVKALLTRTARPLPLADGAGQGAGLLDVGAALEAPTPADATQTWPRAQGTGSLDLARGTVRVSLDGVPLVGEQSIFGTTWSLYGTVTSLLAGGPWSGGGWSGNTWSGSSWAGGAWRGNTWSGNTWSGNTWSGNTWSGNTWSGNTWSGNTWSGNTWSGNTWSGNTWSGNTWSGEAP